MLCPRPALETASWTNLGTAAGSSHNHHPTHPGMQLRHQPCRQQVLPAEGLPPWLAAAWRRQRCPDDTGCSMLHPNVAGLVVPAQWRGGSCAGDAAQSATTLGGPVTSREACHICGVLAPLPPFTASLPTAAALTWYLRLQLPAGRAGRRAHSGPAGAHPVWPEPGAPPHQGRSAPAGLLGTAPLLPPAPAQAAVEGRALGPAAFSGICGGPGAMPVLRACVPQHAAR